MTARNDLAPIRDEAGYETAIAEMRRLWGAPGRPPKPGTRERDRLDVLGMLLDAYEREAWSYEPRDPVEAIRGYMENEGLSHKDLAAVLGSKARASEILGRKRALTLPMIWNLARGLANSRGDPDSSVSSLNRKTSAPSRDRPPGRLTGTPPSLGKDTHYDTRDGTY